jgi:hypothetical protein
MTHKPGPYLQIPLEPKGSAPFYALRFDKSGRSEGPLTQDHLVDAVSSGAFSDVYVFSHGWNNDWKRALDRYRDFVREYQDLRANYHLDFTRRYQPLLAGIFWPSIALVLPWERGPEFAADDGTEAADAVDVALVAEFAGAVDPTAVERYYELAEEESLAEGEAAELIRLLIGLYAGGDPDIAADPGREVEEVLASWATLEASLATPELPESPADFGSARPGAIGSPEAAAYLGKLNPRNLLRGLTVWEMKDRAGRVGAHGVGPLLRAMLDATAGKDTHFHLIGHSYGARLLLTAVGRPEGEPLPRPVDSLLLLQPAVNHLCFAERLPNGKPGGCRNVLTQVSNPILSTFSAHDFPLTKTFHLALRRGKDLGEAEIAADEPPSEYAALGGYGPRGFAEWREVAIKDPTDVYDLGEDAPSLWALNGTRTISGHGAVVNESTAWALFNLASA